MKSEIDRSTAQRSFTAFFTSDWICRTSLRACLVTPPGPRARVLPISPNRTQRGRVADYSSVRASVRPSVSHPLLPSSLLPSPPLFSKLLSSPLCLLSSLFSPLLSPLPSPISLPFSLLSLPLLSSPLSLPLPSPLHPLSSPLLASPHLACELSERPDWPELLHHLDYSGRLISKTSSDQSDQSIRSLILINSDGADRELGRLREQPT